MKTLVSLLLLVSGSVWAGELPTPEDITIPITAKDVPLLNRGYSSRSQNWRGFCVKGDSAPTNENFFGTLSARLDSSQEDAARSLGVQAGGRYRTGVTEISASAELARSAVQTGYSVNFTYKFDVSYAEQYDSSTMVNILPNFKNLLKNERGFFDSCGDAYVSSVSRAARILVNLNVAFSSEEEAQSFAADFKFNSPAVGVTAAIQNASKKVSKKTVMKFYSVQLGGSPGYSGKAICPDEVSRANASGNSCAEPIIQCGFGKFDQCILMLESIVDYSANSFSKQVTKDSGEPKNYAVTAVHTQPYLYAGGEFPRPPDEKVERAFREELNALYGEFEAFFATWVLSHQVAYSGAPRLSAAQTRKMVDLEGHLHKVVNRLTLDIEDCYNSGYQACSEKKKNIASSIANELDGIKRDVGELAKDVTTVGELKAVITALARPETLAQFCDLATDNKPAFKTTVSSLKAWAKARIAERKEGKDLDTGDECANLEAYFKTITDLNLSVGSGGPDYPVGSLEPILALTQLKSLTLNGQNLRDVSGLSGLKQLTTLDLNRNLIEDVCPLASLENLTTLAVASNQLTSVGCLSRAPDLVALDGRGNSARLTCPLRSPTMCKVADYSKALSITEIGQPCGVHVASRAIALDGRHVIVVGGVTEANGFQAARSIDVYERDSCAPAGPQLAIPRANHTLTLTRKGILVAGGHTPTLELIDPLTLSPRLLAARLKTPRAFHTATVLADGRVLFVGGYTESARFINLRSTAISASFEVFNPETETIDYVGTLNSPRAEHTATLLADGRVLITGGYQDQRALTSAEIIDVARGTARVVGGRLNEGRFGHIAARLRDGRVLLAGGFAWTNKTGDHGELIWETAGLGSLEIFDPASETFRRLSDTLSISRGLMDTQTMHDGRILLIGGNTKGQLYDPDLALAPADDPRKQGLKSASSAIDLFDPETEGVFVAGQLNRTRSQAAVGLLEGDAILVIGGMGSDVSLVTAELLIFRP